jgi:hypothetical protein
MKTIKDQYKSYVLLGFCFAVGFWSATIILVYTFGLAEVLVAAIFGVEF